MLLNKAEIKLINANLNGESLKLDDCDKVRSRVIRGIIIHNMNNGGSHCGIYIEGGNVIGDLKLDGFKKITHEVPTISIRNSKIFGVVDFSTSLVSNIDLDGTKLRGLICIDTDISGGISANGVSPVDEHGLYLRLGGVNISRDLWIEDSILNSSSVMSDNGSNRPALSMQSAYVGGLIVARRAQIRGSVFLFGARVAGTVDFSGASITKSRHEECSLNAEGVEIGGAVYLKPSGQQKFQTDGSVRFYESKIRDNFEACGCIVQVEDVSRRSINLHGSKIEGNLFINSEASVNGITDLTRLKVGGVVCLDDAKFIDVRLCGSIFESDVILFDNEKSKYSRCYGKFNFSDAKIFGRLNVTNLSGDLKLLRAKSKSYDDSGEYDSIRKLNIDGFEYERIESPRRSNKKKKFGDKYKCWRNRISWIYKQNKGLSRRRGLAALIIYLAGRPNYFIGKANYKPQNFVQLWKFFNNNGYKDDAKKVARAQLWAESSYKTMRVKILYWLYGSLFGFGYSSRRAIVTLLVTFMLGATWVCAAADNNMLSINVAPVSDQVTNGAYVTPKSMEGGVIQISCGEHINYIVYTFDIMVPVIDLGEEDKCVLVDSIFDKYKNKYKFLLISIPDEIVIYSWNITKLIYSILSWIVMSTSILTFSGLLRQREHN